MGKCGGLSKVNQALKPSSTPVTWMTSSSKAPSKASQTLSSHLPGNLTRTWSGLVSSGSWSTTKPAARNAPARTRLTASPARTCLSGASRVNGPRTNSTALVTVHAPRISDIPDVPIVGLKRNGAALAALRLVEPSWVSHSSSPMGSTSNWSFASCGEPCRGCCVTFARPNTALPRPIDGPPELSPTGTVALGGRSDGPRRPVVSCLHSGLLAQRASGGTAARVEAWSRRGL